MYKRHNDNKEQLTIDFLELRENCRSKFRDRDSIIS